jgi:hypothetical protein
MDSAVATGDTDAIRLALHALLSHCPRCWLLRMLWEPAGQNHVTEQGHDVNAAKYRLLVGDMVSRFSGRQKARAVSTVAPYS